jgi:hypothetical protein
MLRIVSRGGQVLQSRTGGTELREQPILLGVAKPLYPLLITLSSPNLPSPEDAVRRFMDYKTSVTCGLAESIAQTGQFLKIYAARLDSWEV